MSVQSDPPVLPPDSPGSSVSSRLQDEYEDLIRHAVIQPNGDLTAKTTAHQSTFVFKPRTPKKINHAANDLIDLSTPGVHRRGSTESDDDTDRHEHGAMPSMEEILRTAAGSPSHEHHLSSNNDYDDHLLRYSELVTSNLESKPITEKMDHWYLDLKKNLMNEFDQLRLQFLEEAQQTALREKQEQAKEYVRLNQDIKTMREMLIHYEQIIDQKDQTEKNLSKALDLLYKKTTAYQHYYQWRLAFIEKRRQSYALSLAKRFYEDKLKRRALSNWKLLVEREWKKRYELACEKKSKAILHELGDEYQFKCQELELKLRQANEEISRLRMEKTDHDEGVRKAFMRGVCALNMEAMGVLLKDEHEGDALPTSTHEHKPQLYCNQQSSSDEGATLTGTSSMADEDHARKSSSYSQQRYPTHVYKEYLPNTVYRTGEARPFRSNAQRHVTFRPQQSSRFATRNSQILVERHTPANHLRS